MIKQSTGHVQVKSKTTLFSVHGLFLNIIVNDIYEFVTLSNIMLVLKSMFVVYENKW